MCVHTSVFRTNAMEINYETVIFFALCFFWRKNNSIQKEITNPRNCNCYR